MPYKALFYINNLYTEGCPTLIKKGVLFENSENGRLHIQLKFKILTEKQIAMLKVKLFFSDSIGREIGTAEKQYIDITAKRNETFGGETPIFLENSITRVFTAKITEICFSDGQIWNPDNNSKWEPIPERQSIKKILNSEESLNEYKRLFCKSATTTPFDYEDLWICACGNINKNNFSKCISCGAYHEKIYPIDADKLHNDGIYRKATELSNEKSSKDIELAINLFNKIIDWRDSNEKVEKLKPVLVSVKNQEEAATKKQIKTILISTLTIIAAVQVLIISIFVINNINKEHKYQLAKEQISNNEFSNALEPLSKIEEYKDVDKLYWYAEKMNKGDYASVIEKENLTKFSIPDGVTSLGWRAFYGCSGLTSITIPDSVTSIGYGAFYGCSGLTSITIPDSVTSIGYDAFRDCSGLTSVTIPNSVTSLGDYAFEGCRGLTSVTIGNGVTSIGWGVFHDCGKLTKITYKGTKNHWKKIKKVNGWDLNTGNYTIYCTDGTIKKFSDF